MLGSTRGQKCVPWSVEYSITASPLPSRRYAEPGVGAVDFDGSVVVEEAVLVEAVVGGADAGLPPHAEAVKTRAVTAAPVKARVKFFCFVVTRITGWIHGQSTCKELDRLLRL
jgi:hypothetical protein